MSAGAIASRLIVRPNDPRLSSRRPAATTPMTLPPIADMLTRPLARPRSDVGNSSGPVDRDRRHHRRGDDAAPAGR